MYVLVSFSGVFLAPLSDTFLAPFYVFLFPSSGVFLGPSSGVCATKILKYLFKCDKVLYSLVPVRGKKDLISAFR